MKKADRYPGRVRVGGERIDESGRTVFLWGWSGESFGVGNAGADAGRKKEPFRFGLFEGDGPGGEASRSGEAKKIGRREDKNIRRAGKQGSLIDG